VCTKGVQMPDEEDNSSGLEMDMDSVTVVTANTSKLTICDSSTILKLVDLERQLRTPLKEDISAAGDLLSEFLQSSRRLDAMPLRKLRTVLQGRSGFTF